MSTPKVQEAVARVKELPTLPSVLGKILVTAADPDASALDLGKHIAADQSLSATLLKLVNSAYYGFYRQITSITHAIVILGFVEVRNLTLTATVFRTMANGKSAYDRMQLWRHSLATAMAAERIVKSLNMDREGVFESALLHDIGKVTLDMLYPELFGVVARQAMDTGLSLRLVEREIFGLDHAEVGALLGNHWNLPNSVVSAIRFHHQPEMASSDEHLVALISLANYLSYKAELGDPGNGGEPELPQFATQLLDIKVDQVLDVREYLVENQDRIDEFLGIFHEIVT